MKFMDNICPAVKIVETWGQAILLQQIDLSITVFTVQLSQHYHPEPHGGKKKT